ncbi:MAG: hypothetical protein IJX26_03020 [Clostridia bacterium]|nr:hypothetical protein [Clostridia bacterium]
MKFWGVDVKSREKGYFGIRKCSECGKLQDVDLLEVDGFKCYCFFPIKKLGTKRFLVCSKCGAALEISKDLWNYYEKYDFRFDKPTTDEIVAKLNNINLDLATNNIELNLKSPESQQSLNMIYDNLCKMYNNPENVEEIISVYFQQ